MIIEKVCTLYYKSLGLWLQFKNRKELSTIIAISIPSVNRLKV